MARWISQRFRNPPGSATFPRQSKSVRFVTTPESDLDVLVSFAPDALWTLFDLVRMRDELAEMAGRPVDLVEREVIERSANYLRRMEILSSARLLHAEG